MSFERLVSWGAFSMVVACGGAAVPNKELATAQASVRAAEVGGADKSPQAQLRLKQARDKIAEAEKLIAEGENESAARALRCAESDAELALALSREHEAKEEAEEALKKIQRLMEDSKS